MHGGEGVDDLEGAAVGVAQLRGIDYHERYWRFTGKPMVGLIPVFPAAAVERRRLWEE